MVDSVVGQFAGYSSDCFYVIVSCHLDQEGAGCVGQAPALVLEGIARYMDSQCFFLIV